MKKTLTAIALFAGLAAVAPSANAALHVGHNEGLQNYYYYFGSNCCGSTISDRGGRPCGPVAAPCAAPCETCAPIQVRVEMQEMCAPCPKPCDPCDGGWFNW